MDDAVTSYTYDGYNNRIGKVENGVQTSYLYDNRNRLTKETVTENGQTAITSYQYDPNGNLYSRQTLTYGDNTIQEPKASAVLMGYTAETNDMLLEYNNFNQLTTVTKGNEIISYDYYPNGMRKSKTVDGVTTTHIWDGQNMAGEEIQDGFVSYLRGNRLIARQMGDNVQYYHYNGHGDTSSVTDGNGTTLRNYTYDAFGNLGNLHDLDTNPFRYCGEYYDAETGFIYLRNRYYDPSMGRFISEDPIRDGLNWYTYCENNPVMFVDPWGLEITLPGIISVDDERFKALQSLTDDTLNVDLETEIVSYMANESPEREISTNLVREVINDDINCEIVFTKAENGYSRPKYKNGVLVSTQIAFNPSFTFHPWTKFEGENGARRSLMPSFMILGHEMVHTVRRMQGVERDRRDNGAIYLAPPIPGKTLMQVWRPEEIETTGIDYAKVYYDEKGKIISTTRVEASKFYYSENSLRAEYDRVHKNDEGYFPLGLRCIY